MVRGDGGCRVSVSDCRQLRYLRAHVYAISGRPFIVRPLTVEVACITDLCTRLALQGALRVGRGTEWGEVEA